MANDIVWDDEKPDTTGIVWDDEKPKAPAASATKRFLAGVADPGIGAAQLADRLVVNPIRQLVSPGASSMDDYVREREAGLKAEGFDAARMAGNVASPINYLPVTGATGNAMSKAVAAGAAQGMTMPVQDTDNFLAQKASQAAMGGVAGGAGQGLARTLGRAVTPNKEAQALIQQGIQPTVGQAHGGVLNTLEQKATSIPLVGDAVTWARGRAGREFQEKVIERATNGMAKTLDEANAYASKLYDNVVPHLKPTPQAEGNVLIALGNASRNPELTDQGKQILQGLVTKHFANFGQLTGDSIKKLDSEFGYLGRKYAAGDPASRTLSQEIYNVLGAFRTGLEHGLPQEVQGVLREANKTYAQLIPINRAASSNAAERILPRTLQKALARQQRTDVTRMRPDDLVRNAVAILPNTVPDSGTAGRLMLGAGGLVGSGAVGMVPQYLAAGGAALAGATRPVQKFLTGGYSWQPRAEAAINALRRGTPAAAASNRDSQSD